MVRGYNKQTQKRMIAQADQAIADEMDNTMDEVDLYYEWLEKIDEESPDKCSRIMKEVRTFKKESKCTRREAQIAIYKKYKEAN